MAPPRTAPFSVPRLAGAFAWLCTLCVAWCAHAQFDEQPQYQPPEPDEWLLTERWGEVRYGLTVREPIDSLRTEQPRDGSRARWLLPDGANIRLEIQQGLLADGWLYQKIEREDGSFAVAGGGDDVNHQPLRLNDLIADLAGAIEAAGARDIVDAEFNQWVEVGESFIGYINYFAVYPRGDGAEPWLYGIGLVQLDDFNVVILRLECPLEQAETGTQSFEAMLHSVRVESSTDAIERLRGWIDNAADFLEVTTQDDRLAAMRADRLFRVRELVPGRDGRAEDIDIGYMRIWQRYQDADYYRDTLAARRADDPEARLEGIDGFETDGNALVVQSFYRAQGNEIIRLQEYLQASDDGDIDELWIIKTELRQPGARFARFAGTWVETGLRDDIRPTPGSSPINRIQIVREGTPPRQITDFVLAREQNPRTRLRAPSAIVDKPPSGELSTLQWQTPGRAYLSQVDAMLVPAMLPAEEKTYAFFVYHPDSSKLAIRVMRVEPQPGGGKAVYIRPTIDMAEEAMVFDRHGELTAWYFPDGRSMVQTTREELARLWRVRLPRD